ncbi:MAG TPA: glycoside hydrolase family 104 protein [Rhodanobacter sp.]|nr:glycoside hydrolase family 104 protein [Rhodanobacter sp.]
MLDMTAVSEIGAELLAKSDDGYNVLVGSTAAHPILFGSYAAHPHILNHELNSTAAGRYQFIWATWQMAAKVCSLTDFSPVSQDIACVWLLKQCGAYEPLIAGDLDAAMAHASKEWASLPGSTAGQHVNSSLALQKVFSDAGGVALCMRPK